VNRKDFLKTSIYLGAGLSFIGCWSDKTQNGVEANGWKDGEVAHILPTVNHNRMLVSTSFKRVVNEPILKVGNQSVKGQMRDSKGYFWAFDCSNLAPATSYNLRLYENAEPLYDAWPLKTLPAPNVDVGQLKLMVYTCAGGHPKTQDLQHDRILQKMYETKHKKPIMLSGDLHAFGAGKIYRNGFVNMEENPISCYLTGPLGCTVSPSTFRKIKTSTPTAIGMEEPFDNVEENGFSIVDIDSRGVQIKMYNYLWSRDNLNIILNLEPFQNLKV